MAAASEASENEPGPLSRIEEELRESLVNRTRYYGEVDRTEYLLPKAMEIAARLQAIAPPGGVVIPANVFGDEPVRIAALLPPATLSVVPGVEWVFDDFYLVLDVDHYVGSVRRARITTLATRDYRGYLHPHEGGPDGFCLGENATVLESARRAGEIEIMYAIAASAIGIYTANNAYQNLPYTSFCCCCGEPFDDRIDATTDNEHERDRIRYGRCPACWPSEPGGSDDYKYPYCNCIPCPIHDTNCPTCGTPVCRSHGWLDPTDDDTTYCNARCFDNAGHSCEVCGIKITSRRRLARTSWFTIDGEDVMFARMCAGHLCWCAMCSDPVLCVNLDGQRNRRQQVLCERCVKDAVAFDESNGEAIAALMAARKEAQDENEQQE